jgi:hypothetical protein
MIKKGETRHSLKTAGREKEMLLFLTQKHQVKAGKRADVGKKRETKALHNISSITSVTSEQSKTDHLKYFNKYAITADSSKMYVYLPKKAGLNALEGVSICCWWKCGSRLGPYRSAGGRCCCEKIQINGHYHIFSASRAGATRRHARP